MNERASRVSQQRAVAYNLLSEEPCENVYHGHMSEEERLCMIEKQKKFREARLKSESPRRTYEEKDKL